VVHARVVLHSSWRAIATHLATTWTTACDKRARSGHAIIVAASTPSLAQQHLWEPILHQGFFSANATLKFAPWLHRLHRSIKFGPACVSPLQPSKAPANPATVQCHCFGRCYTHKIWQTMSHRYGWRCPLCPTTTEVSVSLYYVAMGALWRDNESNVSMMP
jgi:hypothetical protein